MMGHSSDGISCSRSHPRAEVPQYLSKRNPHIHLSSQYRSRSLPYFSPTVSQNHLFCQQYADSFSDIDSSFSPKPSCRSPSPSTLFPPHQTSHSSLNFFASSCWAHLQQRPSIHSSSRSRTPRYIDKSDRRRRQHFGCGGDYEGASARRRRVDAVPSSPKPDARRTLVALPGSLASPLTRNGHRRGVILIMCHLFSLLIFSLCKLCMARSLTSAQSPPECTPDGAALEVLFLQDISWSFADDLPNMQRVIGEFVEVITAKYSGSKFAFAAFSDIAMPDLGWHAWNPIDKCFELIVPFTDQKEAFTEALLRIRVRSGRDQKEAQLIALQHAVRGGFFSPNPHHAPPVQNVVSSDDSKDMEAAPALRRIVILSTDSPYHEAGDALIMSKRHNAMRTDPLKAWYMPPWEYEIRPNNGDAELLCAGRVIEDYPSVSQVARALKDAEATVIFFAPAGVDTEYRRLQERLASEGFKDCMVIEIAHDSADLATKGVEAIERAICDLRRTTPFPDHIGSVEDEMTTVGTATTDAPSDLTSPQSILTRPNTLPAPIPTEHTSAEAPHTTPSPKSTFTSTHTTNFRSTSSETLTHDAARSKKARAMIIGAAAGVTGAAAAAVAAGVYVASIGSSFAGAVGTSAAPASPPLEAFHAADCTSHTLEPRTVYQPVEVDDLRIWSERAYFDCASNSDFIHPPTSTS